MTPIHKTYNVQDTCYSTAYIIGKAFGQQGAVIKVFRESKVIGGLLAGAGQWGEVGASNPFVIQGSTVMKKEKTKKEQNGGTGADLSCSRLKTVVIRCKRCSCTFK